MAAVPTQELGSVVYLYRPQATANALLTPELSIDAVTVIQIENGEYRRLYLKPGLYSITLQEIAAYTPAQQLALEVKPDSVHYLRMESSLQFETGLRYKSYQRAFTLQQVDATMAVAEIAQCSDAESVPVKNTAGAGGIDAADPQREPAVFSTDKTANPFGH